MAVYVVFMAIPVCYSIWTRGRDSPAGYQHFVIALIYLAVVILGLIAAAASGRFSGLSLTEWYGWEAASGAMFGIFPIWLIVESRDATRAWWRRKGFAFAVATVAAWFVSVFAGETFAVQFADVNHRVVGTGIVLMMTPVVIILEYLFARRTTQDPSEA